MFNWRDFLVLAERLAGADDEASWRSAISRAYYACFKIAEDGYSLKFGNLRSDAASGSHERLWSALDDKFPTPIGEVQIAAVGNRLKRRRVQADYRAIYLSNGTVLNPSEFQVEAEEIVKDAKVLAEALEVVLLD